MNPTLSENLGNKTELITKKVSEIKDAVLSEDQREKYKDVVLSMEQADRLKQGRLTIEELTKLHTEQLRKTMPSYSPDRLKSALKQGKEDTIESAKEAAVIVEGLGTKGASSETVAIAKEKVEEIKDKASDLKDEIGAEGVMVWLEELAKEGGLLGFFASLLLGIAKIFGYKGGIEKVAEKADELIEKLSPEKIKETKEAIVTSIEKSLGKNLSPDLRIKLLNKLDPNNKDSYINLEQISKLQEKLKKGESLNLEDIRSLGILEKIFKDNELKEIFDMVIIKSRKAVLEKLKPYIENSGVKLEGDKLKKFEAILSEEISQNKLIELIKDGKGSVLDLTLGAIDTGLLIPKVIFRCYEEDIIEAKNLVISAGEYGTDKIKIGLKSLSGGDIIPDIAGIISWDDLDKTIENMSPSKKLLLERVFYSELGLVAGVLGAGGFALASGITSIFEVGEKARLGNINIFKEPQKLLTGPAERLRTTLEKLKPGNGVWMDDMITAMKKTEESYKLLDQLKLATTEAEKAKIYGSLGKIEQEVKLLSGKVSIDNTQLYKSGAKSPLQSHYYRNSIKDLEQIVSTNNKLAQLKINGSLSKYAYELKHIVESYKVRYIGANAVLRIGSEAEGKELVKALGKLTPEIIKGFFGRVPIILTSAAMISTFSENKDKSSLKEAFLSTWGFTGGLMLLDEAKIDINDGFKAENIGAAGAGVLVLGTETILIGKDLLKLIPKHGWVEGVGRTALNSAFRIPVEMIKLGGWTIARGNDILKVAGSLLKNSPKKRKIGIGLALAGSAILLARGAMADDINPEELEKKGLIDKEGNGSLDGFKNLNDEIKKDILDLTSISFLDKYFKGKQDQFSFLFENGVYTIKTSPKNLKAHPEVFENIEYEIGKISNETGFNIKVKFES
ncbi:MAG: hypothetical protein PHH98_05460 [Candidatus Gracilibacteria bacterium]|nr:hypothetical protein [Candidatus Gracilibacteria bacterium]